MAGWLAGLGRRDDDDPFLIIISLGKILLLRGFLASSRSLARKFNVQHTMNDASHLAAVAGGRSTPTTQKERRKEETTSGHQKKNRTQEEEEEETDNEVPPRFTVSGKVLRPPRSPR